MEERLKIQSFTDLIAWQKGHLLVLLVYKFTSEFPTKETYSLTDQMRRAKVNFKEAAEKTVELSKLINGLIKSSITKII